MFVFLRVGMMSDVSKNLLLLWNFSVLLCSFQKWSICHKWQQWIEAFCRQEGIFAFLFANPRNQWVCCLRRTVFSLCDYEDVNVLVYFKLVCENVGAKCSSIPLQVMGFKLAVMWIFPMQICKIFLIIFFVCWGLVSLIEMWSEKEQNSGC